MKGLVLLFTATFCFCTFISAQPTLIKDIMPGAGSSITTWLGSQPSKAVATTDNLYFFAADDGEHGIELWKSDGTTDGTMMVKDINPGAAIGNPWNFQVLENVLYFTAEDGTHGYEIWRSDGTEEGTYMLKDIASGSANSVDVFTELRTSGNFVYFGVDDGTVFNELWRTDGTEEGTVLVKDLDEGSSSVPQELYDWNGILYFSASGSEDDPGTELYRSDGTEEGTYMVKNIRPEGFSSFPERMTAAGDLLYFLANDGTHGQELWRTDGTEEGTMLVLDVWEGSTSAFELDFQLYPIGDQLLFVASSSEDTEADLWITDGTAEGTSVLYVYDDGFAPTPATSFELFNGEVFFLADDNQGQDGLWKTDGTEQGTIFLDPFTGGLFDQIDKNILAFDDRLLMVNKSSTQGYEVWESDGTPDDAMLIADIRPGSGGSSPGNLAIIGQRLFFAANDGVNGKELWTYIANPLPISASLVQVAENLCDDDANAALQVNVSGGVPPYTYQWFPNGLEGDNPDGLSPGDYFVTVTDSNNSDPVELSIEVGPDAFFLAPFLLEPETNGQQDGAIGVQVFGGTGSLMVEWNTDPPTTGVYTLENLSAGEYTVTVIDENGCELIETFVVDLVTGVEAPEMKWLSNIHPNPVADRLLLQINEAGYLPKQLLIYNAQGKQVFESDYQNELNVSHLPAGNYWLEISGDKGRQLLSFVKQ